MIKRRRFYEGAISATNVIWGVIWLASVLGLAASIYLSHPIGGVSFLIAVPTTAILVYLVARYLYYSRVRATLVVRTDRLRYRPGDDVSVSVSITADQSVLRSGSVRLRRRDEVGEGAESTVLSEVSLRLPRQGLQLSPGGSYESIAVLSLPENPLQGSKASSEAQIS